MRRVSTFRRVLVVIAAIAVAALVKEFMDVIAGHRTWAPIFALVATWCTLSAVIERGD
jgi:hypothetical protein